MKRLIGITALLLVAALSAQAEIRRAEIKVFGMD